VSGINFAISKIQVVQISLK